MASTPPRRSSPSEPLSCNKRLERSLTGGASSVYFHGQHIFRGTLFIWAVLYVPTIVLTSIPWADSWLTRMWMMMVTGIAGLIWIGIRWDLLAVTGSNCFGKFARVPIPKFMRNCYYGFWTRLVSSKEDAERNWSESLHPKDSFACLAEVFTRQLKPSARKIAPGECLSSPCDGVMLSCGVVKDYKMGAAKVKGHSYSLLQFLGLSDQERQDFEAKRDILEKISKKYGSAIKADTADLAKEFLPSSVFQAHDQGTLYFAVIYLRPKDYHRVHSPANWKLEKRRHFPGSLFPVNRYATDWIPELFALNERVALIGTWKHGFFSSTPVGALNVGSITTPHEPELRTNRFLRNTRKATKNIRYFSLKGLGSYFEEKVYDEPIDVAKGDEQAIFNAGSTVVLVFEGPRTFKFNVGNGEEVKMGQKIGDW